LGQGSETDQENKLFARSVEFYPTLATVEPHEQCIVLPDFAAASERRMVHPEVVTDQGFSFGSNFQLM